MERVDAGSYKALVPSTEQFALDDGREIPGGFTGLSDAGIGRIQLEINGDELKFDLDVGPAVTRRVEARLKVTDSEGSGPFKAEKEVLVLGEEDLVLGNLVIEEPVIWPGGFQGSPVITVKSRDPAERGPDVSCGADERCLLLSSGFDPVGRYESVNDPQYDVSPITAIEVTAGFVDFTLDTGRQIRISRDGETSTRACALAENVLWEVPVEIALDMDEPVLIHTLCPSNPPGALQLIIIERDQIPVLAPLGVKFGGDWCRPGPDCLSFAPI